MTYLPQLNKFDAQKKCFTISCLSLKWSKKENWTPDDSAQNNIRRFIVAQYDEIPNDHLRPREKWLSLNNYHCNSHQKTLHTALVPA
jgi:hypothetical protein